MFEATRRQNTRPIRLILALLFSLLAHGVTGVCTYTLLNTRSGRLVPVFQDGQSALSLTLVDGSDGAQDAPEPAPPVYESAMPTPPPAPIPEMTADDAGAPDNESVVVSVSPVDSPVDPPDPDIVVSKMREATPDKPAPTGPVGGSPGDGLPKGIQSSFVGLDEIRPHYPLGARMRGEEGVVTVKVLVNVRGRAEKVEVVQSSNYPALDRAAIEAVKSARFVAEGTARVQGGEAVLSFRFKLVN
jgi:protein TonB